MKFEARLGLMLLGCVLLLALGLWIQSQIGTPLDTNNSKNLACAISEFNVYSNSTEATYVFGKCYVPVYDSYQTREVCRGGFLGIGQSCYESEKAHTEVIRGSVCFKLKTGERC